VTKAVREITAAEYDAALCRAPAACPLLSVAGDARCGAELLASGADDRRRSLRDLAAGARGGRLLRRLVDTCGPRLAAAAPAGSSFAAAAPPTQALSVPARPLI
jgi:hypothetical protein